MATEKTDVVIVGAGAVGGIVAAELGKAGMKVVALERGPRLKTADFEPHDELRYFQRKDLRPDVKRQPVTWRPNANGRAFPLGQLDYGNQAGGGTVHYGAVSWRLHEDDFQARTNTIARYGLSALPDGTTLADWPLSYAELEPFYDKAEHELGVSGKAGNLQGKKVDGGNPFEAPRQRDYPLPPLKVDQSGVLFEAGAKKLGYHPFSTPRAILSEAYNGRPGCTYCGFCQGVRLPRRGEVEHPRDQAAGGRRHRQFQADHRRHVPPREQRQERTRDRRLLLRARRLRQHGRGGDRRSRHLRLRQHAAASAVEDREVPERARQLERPCRQALHGPCDGRRVRRLRRPLHQQLHGAERPEAHDRRLQRRQFRSCRHRLHPRRPALDRHAQPRRRPARLHDHDPAARRAAMGRRLPRPPRQVLCEARRDGRPRPRCCLTPGT